MKPPMRDRDAVGDLLGHQDGIRHRKPKRQDHVCAPRTSRISSVTAPPMIGDIRRGSRGATVEAEPDSAALKSLASPPPMTFIAKSAKQTAKTSRPAARCIADHRESRGLQSGAKSRNATSRMSDTRFGIVIVNKIGESGDRQAEREDHEDWRLQSYLSPMIDAVYRD